MHRLPTGMVRWRPCLVSGQRSCLPAGTLPGMPPVEHSTRTPPGLPGCSALPGDGLTLGAMTSQPGRDHGPPAGGASGLPRGLLPVREDSGSPSTSGGPSPQDARHGEERARGLGGRCRAEVGTHSRAPVRSLPPPPCGPTWAPGNEQRLCPRRRARRVLDTGTWHGEHGAPCATRTRQERPRLPQLRLGAHVFITYAGDHRGANWPLITF